MSTGNITENEIKLQRIHSALEASGIKKYGRGKKVAEVTGYSPARVSEMLSGRIPLVEKFVVVLCAKFSISEHFVKTGEGDMFRRPPGITKVDYVYEQKTEAPQAIGDQVPHIESCPIFSVTGLVRKITSEENELLELWTNLSKEQRHVYLESFRAMAGFVSKSELSDSGANDSTDSKSRVK